MSDDTILIGFAGCAGTGKDTAAAYLAERYGFVRAAFAQPLREMSEALLAYCGIDHAYIYERHLKEALLPGLGFSVRQLQQRSGTEVVRALNPQAWIEALAMHTGLADNAPVHDRIAITDVRFGNEAAWLLEHGGCLIRLHRDEAAPVAAHVSEAEVDTLPARFDLFNFGNEVGRLHELLDGVLADLGIEPRDGVVDP
jgi:hypothetical protein